jgi:hypothetical protein
MFGAVICIELAPGGEDDAALLEAAPRATSAPAVQRRPNPRIDGLLETALARPLFSSTRRPPQSAADDSAADTDLADKRLTGIVITPDRHIAVFALNDAKPLTLSEGESVSGWRIETIGPIEVSLSGPGGNKTLRPKPDPSLAEPPGVMPAAASALPSTPWPRRLARIEPRR